VAQAGADLERMRAVVHAWDTKEAPFKEGMSVRAFAIEVDIPFVTFYMHACPDKGKRVSLGAFVGPAQLIEHDVRLFVSDVVKRHDRANEGLSRSQVVDLVKNFYPTRGRDAISQSIRRAIQHKPEHGITRSVIKTQATIEKRNQVSYEGQFRWHQTMECAFDFLRAKHRAHTGWQNVRRGDATFCFGE
jgi:hypothetical protein